MTTYSEPNSFPSKEASCSNCHAVTPSCHQCEDRSHWLDERGNGWCGNCLYKEARADYSPCAKCIRYSSWITNKETLKDGPEPLGGYGCFSCANHSHPPGSLTCSKCDGKSDWKPKADSTPVKGNVVSDGSTASYYELPEGSSELYHLIIHKDMNAQMGEIFRAVYRYGQVSHSPKKRDLKKIIRYAEQELERLVLIGED